MNELVLSFFFFFLTLKMPSITNSAADKHNINPFPVGESTEPQVYKANFWYVFFLGIGLKLGGFFY